MRGIEKPKPKKYLKIGELELNNTYICRLSGNKVMITDINQKTVFADLKSIIGIYFNHQKGEYTIVDIVDYMLY